ncbi:spermidine synthase [Kitasatospora sp. MMS16-BH015]|uniref:spermine/spermidine synthase domain-containing protein n=1 Tax=Kitasatospora sp. MMS16-BH015 TaxID=2018025 RepID=UPI000CA27F47|nr:spermidine synthase [Kitasatospora sp. MMS16-BH015]AUG78468.1 spermidine synthase [Kitasatospora sp. MMS16-BH015]
MINHLGEGPPTRPDTGPSPHPAPHASGPRPGRPGPAVPEGATRLRRHGRAHPRAARALVLLAAFVCAACGLVYELELVALGGYLLGDSMTQTSVVLSVMVFAMGVGSLLAKRLTRRPATFFALVECVLALIGGLSVLALYSSWAWLDRHGATTAGLVATTFVIGTLIGAEIPLLMTLIQRIRREDAGRAVADLFAADYVGALIGGLAFPFVLLPALGQATGALATGAVNALAGAAVVLWLFREEPSPRARLLLWTGCGLVLITLAVAAACTGAIERAARQALYGAQVRAAVRSGGHELVLAGGPAPRVPAQREAPLELFVDGRPVLCGPDEYREHEALVRPALGDGPRRRVLLLGGGDGLALREVLTDPAVAEVLVVEPDRALPELARTDPALAELGGHSFADPRARLVTADPLAWLRGHPSRPAASPTAPDAPADATDAPDTPAATDSPSAAAIPAAADQDGPFDVILADLPSSASGHDLTYTTAEFYGLAARRLAPDGRLAVRSGPLGPGLWAGEAGLRAAGLRTVPYAAAEGPNHCPRGPATGQTFVLAARDQPELALDPGAPPPRSLTTDSLRHSADRLAALRPDSPPAPRTLLD